MKEIDDWLKRIGSKAAMEERQKLRAERKINRPLRPHGMANISVKLGGLKSSFGHAWSCRCSICWPFGYPDEKTPDFKGPVTIIPAAKPSQKVDRPARDERKLI